MATKKTTGTSAAKRTRTPRKTGKWIRNLHNSVVHLRLGSRKDPTEVNLEPRGMPGDLDFVPPELIEDGTFVASVNMLVEVITETEANMIRAAYSGIGGYQPTTAVEIIREEDSVISAIPNPDTDIQANPRGRVNRRPTSDRELAQQPHRTNMNVVDVPGSDAGLAAQFAAAQQEALAAEAKLAQIQAQMENPALPPEGAAKPKVTIQRAKGQTNQHTLG